MAQKNKKVNHFPTKVRQPQPKTLKPTQKTSKFHQNPNKSTIMPPPAWWLQSLDNL
jgi:hypothetical protein